MRKTLVSLLSFAAVIAFTGCSKNNDTPSNAASVAFVNGCAGATGVDAKVNNAVVSGAANIALWGNSGYKSVASGAGVDIAYFLTNVGTPVSSQSVSLTAGLHYTAFASGLLTAPSFLLVTDDLAAPASNKAKVRFVNLSPDAMSVTATAQTTEFASGITSLRVSSFYAITAGAYEIKAGDPSKIATIVTSGTQQLSAGKIYTVMLTGTLAGTGQSALKLTLLNNN